MAIAEFVAQMRCGKLSNIIRELFPFKYPMICATLYLGGILMHIWIWSTRAFASTISIPLYSHSFLRISLYSFVFTQFSQNFADRSAIPSVYQLASEFRSENNVILAAPTGMV